MTKRTLLTGLALSGIAFFVVLGLFFKLPVNETTPAWLGKALLFVFFYVLYMTRFLVIQLKDYEGGIKERR
jgi:hypothetical protein